MNVIYVNSRKFALNFARLQSSSSAATAGSIDIPRRIKRKPDDVLKTLAALQTTDITSAHYQFHDDRFLIPYSNQRRKAYALSEESGRSAAKWLHKKYADLFKYSKGEPMIEAYVTGRSLEDFENVQTPDDICALLDSQIDMNEIIQELGKLKDNRSQDFKQAYFELICYLSGQSSSGDRFLTHSVRQKVVNATRNEEVDKLFKELPADDARALNTMIRTLCRNFLVTDAWTLYQKALADGMPIYVDTFNSMLQIVLHLNEGLPAIKWKSVEDILNTMANQSVKPSVQTLNILLEILSSIFGWKDARQMSMGILAEFRALEITPSLASWYHILNIFYRDRSPMSGILVDIVAELEKQELSVQDHKDANFFVTAMTICANQFQNAQLAHRINDLLRKSNNGIFIGDSVKESVYYRNYFQVICVTEPLDSFMEVYHTYVPSVYIPEPSVMETILKTVEMNSAFQYVPLMWRHILLFEHTTRDNLVNLLFRIITDAGDSELDKLCVSIWDKVEENMESRRNTFKWKAVHLSHILTLLCKGDNLEKAMKIFEKINENSYQLEGVPTEDALRHLYKLFVQHKMELMAEKVLHYAQENGLNVTNTNDSV
ncbi:Protein PTCD3 homolog, mitochondrial [Sergentomyia squamirostris]